VGFENNVINNGESATVRIHRGYRYELDPNNRQRTLLAKHAGCARFAYNWGLKQRIKLFYSKRPRFTNAIQQYRELIQLKRTQFIWLFEVPSVPHRRHSATSIKHLQTFDVEERKDSKLGFQSSRKKGVTIASDYMELLDSLKKLFNFQD
jgi:putative transposase